MSTATNNDPRINAVEITDDMIAATLEDGRTKIKEKKISVIFPIPIR
ncbi:MAG: hypothetical protein WCI23_05740 [Chlorobiaceae bacterium]